MDGFLLGSQMHLGIEFTIDKLYSVLKGKDRNNNLKIRGGN